MVKRIRAVAKQVMVNGQKLCQSCFCVCTRKIFEEITGLRVCGGLYLVHERLLRRHREAVTPTRARSLKFNRTKTISVY